MQYKMQKKQCTSNLQNIFEKQKCFFISIEYYFL